SIYPDDGLLLYSLCKAKRPKVVVEIGSHIGYSTICLGQALKDLGGGHLHAFDLFPPVNTNVSPFIGATCDGHAIIETHVGHAGLEKLVTLHKGDSSTAVLKCFSMLTEKIDLAFIDGDHTIRGCLRTLPQCISICVQGHWSSSTTRTMAIRGGWGPNG